MLQLNRILLYNLILTAALLGSVQAEQSPLSLVINEFMASNNSSVPDPQGQYEDWIEIYNFGSSAIDIGGFYLTDDLSNPTKWQIPELTRYADGYGIVSLPRHSDELQTKVLGNGTCVRAGHANHDNQSRLLIQLRCFADTQEGCSRSLLGQPGRR